MGKRELITRNADSTAAETGNQDEGSASLRGLLVRDPYASHLLDGEKIWEIRGRSTHIRGPILIIKSGTGHVFGAADLVRVLGPLELDDLVTAVELPREEREEFRRSGLPYPKTYAYVLSNPRRFERPIPYRHPNGAIAWVRLTDVDLKAVRFASSSHGGVRRDLLHVLATEIWPLLANRARITKAELEQMLGDPTATGAAMEQQTDETRLRALRRALIEGENSGLPTPFDFDTFLARRRAGEPGGR